MISWSSTLKGLRRPEQWPKAPACESVVGVAVSLGTGVTQGFPSLDLFVFSHLWEERKQVATLAGFFEQAGGMKLKSEQGLTPGHLAGRMEDPCAPASLPWGAARVALPCGFYGNGSL